jgi:PmbA protein
MSDSAAATATDLETAAKLAVEAALAAGAEQADAWCEHSGKLTVRVYAGAVENLTEAGSRGVGIRAFNGKRTGYASGTDLSEQGLATVARAAAEAASVTEPDEYMGLPDRCGAASVAELTSPDVEQWGTERKVELALALERAARSRNSLITNVEDTVYADGRSEVALANSDGFAASYEQTSCYAYVYAFAGDGEDRMTGLGLGTARGPGSLDPEAIGIEAADRAIALHGARRPQTRRCPVVLDPYVAASFASIVGGTLSAHAVQRGRSLFAGREGEKIADGMVRLADDGLHPEGLATAPFDGEGVPHQRTVLIEDGQLETFLFDSYTARRGGRGSTGNGERGSYRMPPSVGATNLVLEPGDASLEELVSNAGAGLYVMDVSGLHSGVNPASGTFSVGATGRLIEGGELGTPVRELTIASDLVSMLRAVRGIGSDARWLPFGGSVKAPALMISEMTVAGG